MELLATTAYSCPLTRESGVITMSLTATTDGKDDSSTTRVIEIVARSSGQPNAHRKHHPSIAKATWSRCLDESFDGGNEIVSDENSPILRDLIRMSFMEGGEDDDKVSAAFVKLVHETFTPKRKEERAAAARAGASGDDEKEDLRIQSVTHVFSNGALAVKVEFHAADALRLHPEVEGVDQHAELHTPGSDDHFLSLWYTPPLRDEDEEASPEVSGDAALRALVEQLLPTLRAAGGDLTERLERGLAEAISQRIERVKSEAGRRQARRKEVALAHHRKLYIELSAGFQYEMSTEPHDMVRGSIPLMVHLVQTSASAFPTGLAERQELAGHLLTAAGANNIDFIKIQGPRRVWNNTPGKANQKSGQKRARGQTQLTSTLALLISPTPTEHTLRAIVELQCKAIRQETLRVEHGSAVYDVYVTLGEVPRGEEACSIINIKPAANSSFETTLQWLSTSMGGPFLWRGARTARNISQALPLKSAFGPISILPLDNAGYDKLATATAEHSVNYSITSTCGRTVAKGEDGVYSWDTDLNRTGKVKKRGAVLYDIRLVNVRDLSSDYYRNRVRDWVKSNLDGKQAESKAGSLTNHLHFTTYKAGKQTYHQVHLSNITAKDVADVHSALNDTFHGAAGSDSATFVTPNAQRPLAVEARISDWGQVYKGSQACPKCLQMGHDGDDCVSVHLCDNCYHTAPEGACANPEGCQRFGNGANGRRFEVMRKQQRQQAVIIAMNHTGAPFLLSSDRVVAQIDTNLPTAISGVEQPRAAAATKSSGAIADQQLKKRCSRLAAAITQTDKELDAVIMTLGLPNAETQLTTRQRSRIIAFITNSSHPHGVRVALASEYSMEQLVTGGGYAQSNNMLLQNQMQLQHAMMARQAPPQIQLTPGISSGMGSMHFQTPTQGNAQRTLLNGGSTGFSFPGKKG